MPFEMCCEQVYNAELVLRYHCVSELCHGVGMLDQFFDYFGLTYGVLIILGVGLLIFLLIAVVLERRTKILFPERQKTKSSGFFDDDEEEDDD